MHVVFEGVVPLELSLLLANLIDQRKLFDVTTLNSQLKYHHYGYTEVATKPSYIERESNLVVCIKSDSQVYFLHVLYCCIVNTFCTLIRSIPEHRLKLQKVGKQNCAFMIHLQGTMCFILRINRIQSLKKTLLTLIGVVSNVPFCVIV